MSNRVAVVVFPGSNCEHDAVKALTSLGAHAELVWHTEQSLAGYDAVVLPGGFAHGDYLRPGAIARFSPVMAAVAAFGAEGGPVVGICNGFQVLTEAGLLPGALRRNAALRFLCQPVEVAVVNTASVLTASCRPGDLLTLPINHNEGNYTCDSETLRRLDGQGQVVLRYRSNPNGSTGDIAGVSNEAGNIVGLMPHPERACDEMLGSVDGRKLLAGIASGTPAGAATTAPTAAAAGTRVPQPQPS